MITVSGGRGHFKPHDGQEPVVAICVGGGETAPPTTPVPTTTDRPTTAITETEETTTADTTTTPGTTEAGHCCSTIRLTSSGGVAEHYPELLGDYQDTGSEENGRPVFR